MVGSDAMKQTSCVYCGDAIDPSNARFCKHHLDYVRRKTISRRKRARAHRFPRELWSKALDFFAREKK
jgi:predicted nucleic acid-binding Zn ribbon protein